MLDGSSRHELEVEGPEKNMSGTPGVGITWYTRQWQVFGGGRVVRLGDFRHWGATEGFLRSGKVDWRFFFFFSF